jgi:hypothetical protein
MDRARVIIFLMAILIVLSLGAPAGAKFIGTAVNFDKHFGDTINVGINKAVALDDNSAFGLAGMNVGVTWGVDYDLGTMAGYPYGYGGMGVVTDGGVAYSLGMSLDETHGAGFNGEEYGIPLAEQGITTTHFAQLWANQNQISNTKAIMPFSGFPAM